MNRHGRPEAETSTTTYYYDYDYDYYYSNHDYHYHYHSYYYHHLPTYLLTYLKGFAHAAGPGLGGGDGLPRT